MEKSSPYSTTRSRLPPNERTVKGHKAPRGHKTALNIPIYGHKDPRGPDNNIRVWCDEEDKLHIRIEKTNRCYQFKACHNEHDYVEIIAT